MDTTTENFDTHRWKTQMARFHAGVRVEDRSYHFRKYPRCFVGSEAVSWLVSSGMAATRDEAVALGKRIQTDGLFCHVTGDHMFADSFLFFRFASDTIGPVPDAEVEAPVDNDNDTEQGLRVLRPLSFEQASIVEDRGPSDDEEDVLHVSPMDEANTRLVANVAPRNWMNPRVCAKYNIVVIGAGAGGLVTSIGAAGLGGRVAIIEKDFLGGDCLTTGCVPSKAILRASKTIKEIRRASALGIDVESYHVDFPRIMERMRRLRAEISPHDSAKRLTDAGIDVFFGKARFTGRNCIEVGGQTLRFKRACIATGARAAVPPIPGLVEAGFVTNATIFNLTELPKRMVVIGSGPVGLELGQAFATFGCKVVIVSTSTRVLGREDEQASSLLQRELEHESGVEFHLGIKSSSVSVQQGGIKVVQVVEKDGTQCALEADEILVSAGRAPNVEGMGLECAGVEFSKRGVVVNDHLQTTNGKIYAVGDCCSMYKFTHAADAMARIVIRNALFFGNAKASALLIPWTTFTSPEVAHVGLSEQDIVAQGLKARVFTKEMEHVDRAILDDDTDGFVKIYTAEGSDIILGATAVSSRAGELISEITLAMNAKMGLSKIATVIHPYPTLAEAVRTIGDEFNRTRLTPFNKKALQKLLAFRRS